jgi:sortase (surface protein transpeptidase)
MIAATVGLCVVLFAPTTPVAAHVGTSTPFPVEFDIPKIDARSTLIPLSLNAQGELQAPPVDAPLQAGWYVDGVRPGAVGPAVIAAHVSGRGPEGISVPGVFANLASLRHGDLIHILRSDDSEVSFAVTRIESYSKEDFPTEKVYGNTEQPELRLITCGGTLVDHRYSDNVVVYAVEIS